SGFPWARTAVMTTALTDADMRRIARSGMPAIDPSDGLALFDAALATGAPAVLPVRPPRAPRRPRPEVPHVLRGLIRKPARRIADTAVATTLADRLARLDEAGPRDPVLEPGRGDGGVGP